MKESKRQRQFSSLIQKDLSDIFQRNGAGIVGSKAFVTVTKVTMSPDLGVAKVYLSFMLSENKQALLDNINMKKSEIRRLLGNRIGKVARVVPELVFYLDDSAEYAARIDNLLANLDIPPAENENNTEEQ